MVYLKQHIIDTKGYFDILPEYLVPPHFHLSSSPDNTTSTDNSENLTQRKVTLNDYESDILISLTATGQSWNMLSEERDRYLKERLFRAVEVESFSRLLNSLQAEGNINVQELSRILTQKTAIISEQGNKIWLNLVTHGTNDPTFYSLEER